MTAFAPGYDLLDSHEVDRQDDRPLTGLLGNHDHPDQ